LLHSDGRPIGEPLSTRQQPPTAVSTPLPGSLATMSPAAAPGTSGAAAEAAAASTATAEREATDVKAKKATDNAAAAERAAVDAAVEEKAAANVAAAEGPPWRQPPQSWLSPLLLLRREPRGQPYLAAPHPLPSVNSVALGSLGTLSDIAFVLLFSMFILRLSFFSLCLF
jgi:hypothetical protein